MACTICEDAKAGKIPYYVTHYLPAQCGSLYHYVALGQKMACPRCGFHEPKQPPMCGICGSRVRKAAPMPGRWGLISHDENDPIGDNDDLDHEPQLAKEVIKVTPSEDLGRLLTLAERWHGLLETRRIDAYLEGRLPRGRFIQPCWWPRPSEGTE